MASSGDKSSGPGDLPVENDDADTIVENLYKKNIELLVKNKTLSLLSKLYEIGILTLEPKDLAVNICQTVQSDLSLEVVCIHTYSEEEDCLNPLACSKSEKTESAFKGLHLSFQDMRVNSVSKRAILTKVVKQKEEAITDKLEDIWSGVIDLPKLQVLTSESNIKTTLLYPLKVESRVLGVIMMSLNRNYDALSTFEKESIKSFINIIALALEKAYLYQELQNANTQLRELDRQKDELLSIVSHQLAAPVTAVKWYLELFTDGGFKNLSEDQIETIETMKSIGVNLSDLVSMILDVSRIQLGRMKVDQDEFELNEFFKDILAVIEPKAAQKNIEFIKDVPADLPKAVLDRRLTRMTIENLLTNAVKYTPEKGKVEFRITREGNTLRCMVKDTGVGIPKEEQAHAFDKLFRASNVRNKFEGNGFGLYVAKGAIEAQGGKIWFESKENKGTTFYVTLPLSEK